MSQTQTIETTETSVSFEFDYFYAGYAKCYVLSVYMYLQSYKKPFRHRNLQKSRRIMPVSHVPGQQFVNTYDRYIYKFIFFYNKADDKPVKFIFKELLEPTRSSHIQVTHRIPKPNSGDLSGYAMHTIKKIEEEDDGIQLFFDKLSNNVTQLNGEQLQITEASIIKEIKTRIRLYIKTLSESKEYDKYKASFLKRLESILNDHQAQQEG